MANVRYIATVEMEGIKEKYRDKIEKEFVKRYHEIVDEVNPKLEGWNKEYDAEYGDLKNPDGTVNEDHYNSWIKNKVKLILKTEVNFLNLVLIRLNVLLRGISKDTKTRLRFTGILERLNKASYFFQAL